MGLLHQGMRFRNPMHGKSTRVNTYSEARRLACGDRHVLNSVGGRSGQSTDASKVSVTHVPFRWRKEVGFLIHCIL